MKFGTGIGNKKYKFKFEYKNTKRITAKNIKADNLEQARKLFTEIYKDYNVEILEISEVKE